MKLTKQQLKQIIKEELNNNKEIALSDFVKKELQQDKMLFVAWCLKYGTYDSDVDPLHNSGWVKTQKVKEAEQLKKLKLEIAHILNLKF